MNTNKVTVEQFLNAGFEFVVGDIVTSKLHGTSWDRHVTNPISWNIPSDKDSNRYVASLAPRPNKGTQPVVDDCVVEVKTKGIPQIAKAKHIKWHDTDYIISWIPYLQSIKGIKMNDKQESAINVIELDIEDAFTQPEGATVEREFVESDKWVNGLPPVGYEFHVDEEAKYDSHTWLFEEKTGWEHEDLIRVVYADDDLDFVVCLNTQHDMLTVANIKADFFMTPEQLAEKDREEAAYDLYVTGMKSVNESNYCTFAEFKEDYLGFYIAIVDKTGYRK